MMNQQDAIKIARKKAYDEIRYANPGMDKQVAKNLAYDSIRQAVKNLTVNE